MADRLQQLRERTNGYTVTPEQYVRFAYGGLVALTLIVLTGAAVRLTGSGLGCPTWPKCYGNVYPPLQTHALIEFSNRLVTVPVSLAAGFAWLAAVRRRPYRRDLVWLGALLPLGVVAQAVLGGFTVKGALDYGWVMGHFALSMLILVAAVVLVWRALEEPRVALSGLESVDGVVAGSGDVGGAHGVVLAGAGGAGARRGEAADPAIVRALRWLVALGALTIFAGTAATAAGPHAGGSPGQKINRLDFDGRGTMDFVIHRHAEIALVFSVIAVLVWWLARRREAAATIQRPLTVLCVLLALQGAVGLDQYETHLPTELVWVHVALASCAWLSVLWAACAAGSLARVRVRRASDRPAEGSLRTVAPVKFPGN
ncbi:MAG TPA: COX15/CtaA family protein [Solirubrobacteraceae bacterium]|jgi:cytochrome c oxidase assembly protein subunit 15|nr:COX15/CtaA family protein [Solirubrobacteraceae bacterium]